MYIRYMYVRIGRVIKKYPYTNEIRECVVKDGREALGWWMTLSGRSAPDSW
jgi:hypothetical protein